VGSYATTTSLQTLMVGTTFDTTTTALGTLCITNAENEINKYLGKRYDITSFTTTSMPPMITTMCQWLSIGYMYENMARGGKEAYGRADRYIDKAISNLKDIRDYKLDLVDTSGASIADKSTAAFRIKSSTSGYTETFQEDDPLNWVIDPDKETDIDRNR